MIGYRHLTSNVQWVNVAGIGSSRTPKGRLRCSALRSSTQWQNTELRALSRSSCTHLGATKKRFSSPLADQERRASIAGKSLGEERYPDLLWPVWPDVCCEVE